MNGPAVESSTAANRTGGRRRRTRWLAAAALVATVATAGGVAAARQGSSDGGERSGNQAEGAPIGRWARVADSPLTPRANAQVVWTGEEVLVIGGTDDDPCHPSSRCLRERPSLTDGAAYDPSTDQWRAIAPVPVPFEWGQRHAFVDGHLYIALQDDLERLLRYDVAADRWDWIPAPDSLALRTLVADGDRLLAPLTTSIGVGPEVVDVALDPSTGRWTGLPSDPLRPSEGRQLVGVDGRSYLFTGGLETDRVRAAVLTDGTWRTLPDPGSDGYLPALAADGLIMSPQDDDTAGDGDGVPGRWALDTNTDEWVDVPEVPDDDGPNAVDWLAGDDVILVGDVVLDVATRRWAPLDAPDELDRIGIQSAWGGDRAFAFGGTTVDGESFEAYDTPSPHADLWTWTPNP